MTVLGRISAGVSQIDITPEIGVDLVGTSRRSGAASGIYMELKASCLVLSDGEQLVAILDADLLAVANPTASTIRDLVAKAIGTKRDNVLLSCTHTHGGPATSVAMPKIGGRQHEFRTEELAYMAALLDLFVTVSRAALRDLRPARAAVGVGKVALAVNRRLTLSDGRTIIGPNFDGPCDESVGVIRIDDGEGRPLACVVNFAAHPCVLSPVTSRLISPDYPGPLRATVTQLTGATSIFLQGASGNIIPRQWLAEDTKAVDLLGKQIACEVGRVYFGLQTESVREEAMNTSSVSELRATRLVPTENQPMPSVRVATLSLTLQLATVPTEPELVGIMDESRATLDRLRSSHADPDDINPTIYHLLWAQRNLELIQKGLVPTSIDAEVQVMACGDAAIVAVPGELFAETGLDIKSRSPFSYTIVAAYSNGMIGYIPPYDAYALGGYEVEQAHRGYGLPSALASGSAERIADEAVRLLVSVYECQNV